MELIEKRFAPPQLTYNRFKRVVDDSHETFYSQLNAGYNILEMSNEYSTKVEDELKKSEEKINGLRQKTKLADEALLLKPSYDEDFIDEIFKNSINPIL